MSMLDFQDNHSSHPCHMIRLSSMLKTIVLLNIYSTHFNRFWLCVVPFSNLFQNYGFLLWVKYTCTTKFLTWTATVLTWLSHIF